MSKIIAITANTSWYLYNFRANTFLEFQKKGYYVIAIAPEDEYSSLLVKMGVRFIPIDIDAGGTNPIRDIKTLLSFYRIYRKERADCVLNFTPKNNIYSSIAASLLKIPTVNNIAGLGLLFVQETIPSKIARILYKVSQRKATRVFFQNEDDRELFKKHNIAPIEKTDRLPGSGVDLSRFVVRPAPDDGVVRFLLVARMLYDKGIEQYVEAARRLKKDYAESVEFYLLGFLNVDNPNAITREMMDEWVAEGSVNYLGISDSVEDEIAKVDCVVLPSFYREGVPKSLLEAGAMGKPIITTDNVGCRETVDEGINGYLCEARSVDSLSNCMEKIVNLSHENRIYMGDKSRKKVAREFDENIVIKKYLDVVSSVTKQS